jgi:ATP-dependent RNA helicase DeaD
MADNRAMSADRIEAEPAADFRALQLPEPLLRALSDVGYESPSPIQAQTMPLLLSGRDVLGQAQTGTGKTAAFALPILARLDLSRGIPQALVLAPTRELAIQVAEAFQKYATHLPGFHVLPIYGGQAYGSQLHGLKRGVHVVVGTPGRIIDHLERGSLDLSQLKYLVLDEADEMLRMGFIDDVEKILQKTPASRQTALFSATMPPPIRRIAQTYLRSPSEITIEAKTRTADNIRQRYWLVSGMHKLDALTRILEAETFDGMIIFARTKQATEELAEKLAARGFAAAAINGDIAQPLREKAIARLKDGQLDILVATDVAARGLDVDRISHVLNYDIPYDTESYVHRIGRTGRAGRTGDAILFVAPRERGMLRAIERATRQPITPMELPSVETVNDQRMARFRQRIRDSLSLEGLTPFQQLVEAFERDENVPAIEIAAGLARLLQGETPLLLQADPPARKPREERPGQARPERYADRERAARDERPERRPPRGDEGGAPIERTPRPRPSDQELETFRIEVGHSHRVKPGNIVGAIANEAGLESRHIGRIDIRDDHTFIDLPRGMPDDILQHLQSVWVAGQRLRIKRHAGEVPPAPKIRRSFETDRRGPPRGGPRRPRSRDA